EVKRSDLSAEQRTALGEAVALCEEFVQNPQGWLVLAGTYGCGKTHLAAAIANEFVEQTRTEVMFVVVPDLLDHLRAAFSPQASTPYDRRFDEIKRAPLLVLDDLGTESATPWAREKLFQLLNFRYNALLPTVITTSADPKQIEPWLRTRMLDVSRCQYVAITAPGYRGSRSQQQATPRPRAPRRRSS
ncbi:MAG: ATP-binding protein, partial [Caldilineaceae bacterium]|nr:ATP-binding protein [Caldilineaceae bacterium]